MRMAQVNLRRDGLTKVLREELDVSEGIVRDGRGVIPRLRILAPREQFVILLRLPEVPAEHRRLAQMVEHFMAWKLATAFILSGERCDPHAIASLAVARDQHHGIMRRLDRGPPLQLWPVAALPDDDVERGLSALLPGKHTTMTRETVAELEFVFGTDGAMPALRVA